MDTDISSKKFDNLIKEDCNALYNLRDDPTITINGTDKGSAMVIWDREDYLKEVFKPLKDNLSNDTRNYFLVKDPKFARFYLFT